MPVTRFHEYARNITDRLHAALHSSQARSLSLEVDQRSMSHGLISGLLTFEDQSELHFREYVDTSQTEPKVSFAYHYQDAAGTLIFRYDDAAHRPSLLRRPHKHTPINVIECPAPTLAGCDRRDFQTTRPGNSNGENSIIREAGSGVEKREVLCLDGMVLVSRSDDVPCNGADHISNSEVKGQSFRDPRDHRDKRLKA